MLCTMLRLLLLGAFSVSVLVSNAQDFSELEARLWEHPALAQFDYQAIAFRERAVAAYALPDPEISLAVNNVPLSSPSFDRFLPSNKSVGIQQRFPSRSGRKAKSSRINEEALQVDARTAKRFAELRADLLVDLIQLERIRKQRVLAEQQLAKYQELTEVAEAEIDAGRPVVFRLSQIVGQRAQVGKSLIELDGETASIQAAIIEKIGYVPLTTAPALSSTTWTDDPQQFYAVRVAALGHSVAEQGIVEAEATWKTQWGVELAYQQRESGRGLPDADFPGDDWFSAKVSFSIPLWGKRKQAPNVRAANAQKNSARAHVQTVVKKSIAQRERFRVTHETAEAGKHELRNNIRAILSVIEAQQTQYESGAGDYAPVIDSEIAVLVLRGQLAAEDARSLSAIALMNAMLVSP